MKFVLVQDIVWIDFLISDFKFNYTGKFKITKIKSPLIFIGDRDTFCLASEQRIFQALLKCDKYIISFNVEE